MKQYDHLKKNLREYKVDVDKEKLWQQTAHAIPQKKKRRTLVIPFLFGALLLSGGLAFYNDFKPLVNALSQVAIVAKNDIEYNQPVESISNVYSASNNLNKNISTSGSNQTEPVESIENENVQFQKLKNSSQNQNNVSFAGFNTQRNSATSISANQGHFGTNSKTESNHAPILTDNINSTKSEAAAPAAYTRMDRNTNYLTLLPLSQITSGFNSEIAKAGHITTPARQHRSHIFSLYALQSVGFTNLQFDAGNQEAKVMRDFLVPVTRSLESVSTTMRGNVRLAKGFAVSAGLAYRRLTTQTNYNNTITERTEQEGTTTIIIDELGQQHFVSGNLGSTHTVETEYNRFSTHQNIDVELTLHKTIFEFHRTTINGFLKAGVNVLYSGEGSAFTDELELVKFSDADNPFSLRSPFTYGAGMDIQYRLSPRLILVGSAGIDQLNYHHEDYNQLQWKHTIYALSLGVGYVL